MREIPCEEKLRTLAGAVYSAAEMGMWCFGSDRELFYSTCPNEKEFLMLLELGGCLDFVYEREGGCDKPAVLSDSTNLMWIAEHVYKDGKPSLAIIMGPVFLSSTPVKNIEDTLKKMEFSISVRKQMMRILANVPVVMRSMLNQYSIMLHYMITEKTIRPRDFIYQNKIENTVPEDIDEEAEEGQQQEGFDADRVVKGEKLILQAIREGNLNYLQVLDEECDFGGEQLTHTGDSLRDAKNTMLIFCALCSRAAMEGGVSAKTSKELEARYITQIEACTTLTKLTTLNIEMMKECVQRVDKSNQNPQISSIVSECCDYVRANVLKPLTVEMLAREMGYTEYYFTKKFYKEMGIRLTDFIKQARIEYAKITLITTKKSIQDISDSLHFGTRNYFSKVFHDIVGMTPADYRERMGREEKFETKR